MSTERWDIQAKAEGVQGQLPIGQMLKMLQALITDRFKLEVHHESKEMTVYALVVGKNGSKLTPHTGEPPQPTDRLRMRPGSLSAKQVRIAALVRQLTPQLWRQVIDKTGLTGEYDFTLEWTPEPGQGGPESNRTPSGTGFSAGIRFERSFHFHRLTGAARLAIRCAKGSRRYNRGRSRRETR